MGPVEKVGAVMVFTLIIVGIYFAATRVEETRAIEKSCKYSITVDMGSGRINYSSDHVTYEGGMVTFVTKPGGERITTTYIG